MIDAYIDWRDACRAVNDAYCGWTSATGVDAAGAFTRYCEALDSEEFAAGVYAELVRRVGRYVAGEHDHSALLGSQARGAS